MRNRGFTGFAAIAALLLGAPAAAQFGSFPLSIPTSRSQAEAMTDAGCKTPKKKKGAAIFGKIAGQLAGNAINRTGAGRFLPVSEFTSTLTESIACRLDPEEQKQAATATDTALRSEKVGASSTWSSETRENVQGTSTVTALATPAQSGGAPGQQGKTKCLMVTDIIIVDGEETRAEKKMCKGPGQTRYAIAQV